MSIPVQYDENGRAITNQEHAANAADVMERWLQKHSKPYTRVEEDGWPIFHFTNKHGKEVSIRMKGDGFDKNRIFDSFCTHGFKPSSFVPEKDRFHKQQIQQEQNALTYTIKTSMEVLLEKHTIPDEMKQAIDNSLFHAFYQGYFTGFKHALARERFNNRKQKELPFE